MGAGALAGARPVSIRRERDAEARWQREGFLRAGQGEVDAPRVAFDGRARERGHDVGEQERLGPGPDGPRLMASRSFSVPVEVSECTTVTAS